MWEPFSEGARAAIVRAQVVAQRWNTHALGVLELACALVEGDDAVARILSDAFDLTHPSVTTSEAPPSMQEMVFTPSAKRSIELSFASAQRLTTNYIGSAHLALGILDVDDAPPLRAGTDPARLRAELDAIAVAGNIQPAQQRWTLTSGDATLTAMMAALMTYVERSDALTDPGSTIALTIHRPDGYEKNWVWTRN